MTHILFFIYLALIFDGRGHRVVSAIDPLEGIIKDFAYAARRTIEQALNQMRFPKLNAGGGINGLSFQTDDEDNEKAFLCPLCTNAQKIKFSGTWNVVLWSRSFYLTMINDLNRVIDKLESGKPIYTDQGLTDLFAEPPEIRCPRLTILNSTNIDKFEFVYQLLNGRQKSIIGQWEIVPDNSFLWRIAPTLNARCKYTGFCIAFTNMAMNQTSDYDFVVFNQIDSWPSCSNYIAMARTRTPDLVNNLRDLLEQQKVEGAFNKIEKVLCPYTPQEILPVPYTPLPEDPFALPNNIISVDTNNSLT